MILLSTAAKNIFWLGRYLSRIQQACHQLPFTDDKRAVKYAHAFCLPAWDAQSLNGLFLDPEQPFSIQSQFRYIRTNIQQLRAVFSPVTYAELNRLTKDISGQSEAICQVVQECSEILEGEIEQIFLFYRLGRVVEDLDHQCRMDEVTQTKLNEIDDILELLKNYGWYGCGESWQQLCQSSNMNTLYEFSDDLAQMFEVCE
ncbi:alpha-E domain-containing protein [Acinetobacter qingfengensis]|uniref:DUF403 domain-containing protein n=1 Tax=Acinetobacter qingfengensis TaxID=1262585 RepID=A0A1E7REL2_9GAMM|nr:alpha-E domain-containing protein [Acinetobacter qingfengensis]KAA8735010.1 alpha-E domain-containing protein [Acinetobacter qingfengensis]OEY97733.1 hypothetical protein BJI46_08235 [Acinetobacter qingfengensis]